MKFLLNHFNEESSVFFFQERSSDILESVDAVVENTPENQAAQQALENQKRADSIQLSNTKDIQKSLDIRNKKIEENVQKSCLRLRNKLPDAVKIELEGFEKSSQAIPEKVIPENINSAIKLKTTSSYASDAFSLGLDSQSKIQENAFKTDVSAKGMLDYGSTKINTNVDLGYDSQDKTSPFGAEVQIGGTQKLGDNFSLSADHTTDFTRGIQGESNIGMGYANDNFLATSQAKFENGSVRTKQDFKYAPTNNFKINGGFETDGIKRVDAASLGVGYTHEKSGISGNIGIESRDDFSAQNTDITAGLGYENKKSGWSAEAKYSSTDKNISALVKKQINDRLSMGVEMNQSLGKSLPQSVNISLSYKL